MSSPSGNRVNLIVGALITALLSFVAIGLLLNEYRRPVFSAQNAWLWFALLALVPLGLVVAIVGLRRRIGCGYFIWSQTVLCFLVSMSYVGWYRRELDYVKMGPDPDALDQRPPSASLTGYAVLVLMWLVVGFLPLAIRQLRRRKQAKDPA